VSQALVVLGAGGHSRPLIDAALEAGFEIHGVIDLDYHGQSEHILGCEILGGPELLDDATLPRAAVVAIGDNGLRRVWFERLQAGGWTLPRIVHPRALVSRFCEIGQGAFVNVGAMLNAGVTIGDDTIVNTGALVDHEAVVSAHSHIGPGARLAGRVTVGEQSFVGAGATVIQQVRVGDRAVIGAGAAIIRDVADGATVVGVPGRVLG
jgi:sugar O-acyltransferase (sialic acid O-acetyltransferase NeuD family)